MRIDPTKLKEVFARMNEIDENPESETAKEYYKAVEQLEKKRSKSRKKPAKIIIRTVKRGRTISQEEIEPLEVGSGGEKISAEEAEFNRKYVDYSKFKWPEVNEIEMTRPDYRGKGTVKL